MLTENDVISAVCAHLTANRCSVSQSLNTNEQGVDIVAVDADGVKVLVEAKGQTSSKAHTKNFGNEFTPNQKYDHVAKAFFTAARLRGEDSDSRVVIALPGDPQHRSLVRKIHDALVQLRIEVFLVDTVSRRIDTDGRRPTT